jgi:hypothetical protein
VAVLCSEIAQAPAAILTESPRDRSELAERSRCRELSQPSVHPVLQSASGWLGNLQA